MLPEGLLPRNLHGTINCVHDGHEGDIRHLHANIRVFFFFFVDDVSGVQPMHWSVCALQF